MKRFIAFSIGVMFMLTATGCGDSVTLTEQQNDKIAEYVAGVMLKYSYKDKWNYQKAKAALKENNVNNVSSSVVPEPVTQASTTPTTENPGASQTTGQSTDQPTEVNSNPMQEISSNMLGTSGAVMTYNRYVLDTRYPTEEYTVCVPADPGSKVLAVEFTITNSTSNDVVLNSVNSNLTSKLEFNSKSVNQSTSMLKNDIANLKDITVKAGESYVVAAIYQISDSDAADISNMKVTFYSNSTSLGSMNIQ